MAELNVASKFADVVDGKIFIIIAGLLMFLIGNFNESFGLVFLGVAVFSFIIFSLEKWGLVGREYNFPFLGKLSWGTGFLYGVAGLIVFAGFLAVYSGLSLGSIVSLQSQRVLLLANSKVTEGLAQALLVPLVENVALGQGLQLSMNLIQPVMGNYYVSGFFSSVLVGAGSVLMHSTAKFELGVTAIVATFLFFFMMSMLTVVTKSIIAGMFSHWINNSFVVLKQLGYLAGFGGI